MTKRLAESSLFNVLMFSVFWAFQIFFAKLGFNAGAMAIPLQLVMVVTAMVTLGILILPRSGLEIPVPDAARCHSILHDPDVDGDAGYRQRACNRLSG